MTVRDVRIPVALPKGDAEVSGLWSGVDAADATIALAHGAGAGMTHPFLGGLAAALVDDGFSVLRFVFPYVECGRRMPGPAAHAVATWAGVQAWLAAEGVGSFIAAGKSYGGRMASLATAAGTLTPAGLVYLGYPLHPPGRPDKPRAEAPPFDRRTAAVHRGGERPLHRSACAVRRGGRDLPDARVEWIAAANHSFEVKGTRQPAQEIGARLAEPVGAFTRAVLGH